MHSLNQIKSPIQKELDDFEPKFRASMKSSVPLLDKITHYIVKRKGKQLRPVFVFLSAKICGDINESTYRAAALIELLHTATLVHDDVVDDSYQRRGFFSLNALWKNKIAVLVGDYLLSKGLMLSVDNNDYRLLHIVTDAVKQMSEGELLQIEKARNLDIKEPVYFDIIRQKTASLIASCCACGAASTGADEDTVNKLRLFGETTGIAFQIKDDLFDYESNGSIGKPGGIDIKERKMTLPLIYALNNATYSDKKRIINIIKNHNNKPDKVEEVLSYVKNSMGIDYAVKTMNEYKDKALEMLEEFPACDSKTSLEELVRFTINRRI